MFLEQVWQYESRARHPGMGSQVGLKKHTINKACEGNGIPAVLFQVLKDDDVKVLHSICQQIWKTRGATEWQIVSFHFSPK